jgi:hypothetical protein
MLRHAHLHCMVTGGGLSPEGEWKSSWKPDQKPFLIRSEVLMERFRSLFCRALKRLVKKERLELPEGCEKQQMLNLINKVNRKKWDVFIAKPAQDGGATSEEILSYLKSAVAGGPLAEVRIEPVVQGMLADIRQAQERLFTYLRQPPLANGRLQEVSEQTVSFRCGKYDPKSGRRDRETLVSLPLNQFLGRLLWHVPPPKFQTVRHYGLYTSAKKTEYEKCRTLLGPLSEAEGGRRDTFENPTSRSSDSEGWIPLEEYMEQRSRCPVCGKKLVISQVLPSSVTGEISPRDKALARKLSQARRRRRGS